MGNRRVEKVENIENELLNDMEAFNKRTGNKLDRVSLTHLTELERNIRKLSPYRATLDVNRPQLMNTDEISYTDVFKNAIFVTPQNDELAFKIAHLAHKTYCGNLEEDRALLLQRIDMRDKYTLDKNVGKHSSVCILPGSNLMRKIVGIDTLARWAYYDSKLVFKMHPLTSDEDRRMLHSVIGVSRIVPKTYSGFELMRNADRIYCCSNSELGLYAALLGKEVIDITRFTESSSTTYAPLYRFLNYPYNSDDLVKVLSNPISGLFFYQVTTEETIKRYFDTMLELQSINMNYSNIDYKLKIQGRSKK